MRCIFVNCGNCHADGIVLFSTSHLLRRKENLARGGDALEVEEEARCGEGTEKIGGGGEHFIILFSSRWMSKHLVIIIAIKNISWQRLNGRSNLCSFSSSLTLSPVPLICCCLSLCIINQNDMPHLCGTCIDSRSTLVSRPNQIIIRSRPGWGSLSCY